MAMPAGGCNLPGMTGSAPAIVSSVDLQAMPTAVNIDNRPGPDAVQAMVYLYELDQPKPGNVRTVEAQGNLEFLLYDGNVSAERLEGERPMQVFEFTPQQLGLYKTRGMAGVGYGVQLAWERPPRAPTVTLIARYNQGGRTVYSAPVGIAVRLE
jgi:hypothetical protein